jgi:hypothetical protein
VLSTIRVRRYNKAFILQETSSEDDEKIENVEVKIDQKIVNRKKPQKEASYITGGCFCVHQVVIS